MALICLGMADVVEVSGSESVGVKVGDMFPDLKEYGLEGDVPASVAGKVVLVDFWASWCGPCRGTFPLMEEMHKRFSKQGLLILAVNEDKSRVAMAEFLKDHKVSFLVLRDAGKKLVAKVNVAALPTSYVLDRSGRVVLIQSGATTLAQSKDFVKKVQDLLESPAITRDGTGLKQSE